MSTSPTSPDVPFPAASDFNFLLLGFRLGQVLEVCKQTSTDDEPLALLLPLMLSSAVRAAGVFGDQEVGGRVDDAVTTSRDIWRRRAVLAEDLGSAAPFTQIAGVIRITTAGIRNSLSARGGGILFRIGELLSQGAGYVDPDDLDAGADWGYVALDGTDPAEQLERLTTQVGMTIEQLTGLPAELSGFLQTVDGVDEILIRYPQNCWGWAFIEDRISAICAGSYTISGPPPVSVAVEPGYLGLLMPEDRSTPVCRAGMSNEVSLTETQFRLLRQYYSAGESGVSKNDLKSRWRRISQREAGRPEGAINSHNSELRRLLKPLGLDVLGSGNGADQRWRLAELPVEGERQSPSSADAATKIPQADPR